MEEEHAAQHPGGLGLPEVLTFRPSDEEWADPLAYIASIRETAEAYGLAKVRRAGALCAAPAHSQWPCRVPDCSYSALVACGD